MVANTILHLFTRQYILQTSSLDGLPARRCNNVLYMRGVPEEGEGAAMDE